MEELERKRVLRGIQEQMESFSREGMRSHHQEGGLGFMDQQPNKEEEEQRPEDLIPDKPENAAAREFLKNAPSKGLWMPLGTEVKVMKCWRCKAYGHRTGDRECPMSLTGNLDADAVRQAREDPMASYVARTAGYGQAPTGPDAPAGGGPPMSEAELTEKRARLAQLTLLVAQIRAENREKKEKKRRKKEKKRKRNKQEKHEHKHESKSKRKKKRKE